MQTTRPEGEVSGNPHDGYTAQVFGNEGEVNEEAQRNWQHWFRRHYPNINGSQPDVFGQGDIFLEGFGSNDGWENSEIAAIFDKAIKDYGIHENKYPPGNTRLERRVDECAEEVVRQLKARFQQPATRTHLIPLDWMEAWTRALLIFLPDGQQLNVPYRRILTPTRVAQKSADVGRNVALRDCEFLLVALEGESLSDTTFYHDKDEMIRIPALSCLEPGGQEDNSQCYLLSLFKENFDNYLRANLDSPPSVSRNRGPYLLDLGKLVYCNRREPLSFAPVECQIDFAIGVDKLYRERESSELRFGYIAYGSNARLKRKSSPLLGAFARPDGHPPRTSSRLPLNPKHAPTQATGSRPNLPSRGQGLRQQSSTQAGLSRQRPKSMLENASMQFGSNTITDDDVRALRDKFRVGQKPTIQAAQKALANNGMNISLAFKALGGKEIKRIASPSNSPYLQWVAQKKTVAPPVPSIPPKLGSTKATGVSSHPRASHPPLSGSRRPGPRKQVQALQTQHTAMPRSPRDTSPTRTGIPQTQTQTTVTLEQPISGAPTPRKLVSGSTSRDSSQHSSLSEQRKHKGTGEIRRRLPGDETASLFSTAKGSRNSWRLAKDHPEPAPQGTPAAGGVRSQASQAESSKSRPQPEPATTGKLESNDIKTKKATGFMDKVKTPLRKAADAVLDKVYPKPPPTQLPAVPTGLNEHYHDGRFREVHRDIYLSGGDTEIPVEQDELDQAALMSSDGQDAPEQTGDNQRLPILQDLLTLNILAQMTNPSGEDRLTKWEQCCRLFQIDPQMTSMEERVKVAGLNLQLYQYQAFAVFWQMITSRTSGGGFLADAPGLGKTLTFLALVVVERQLAFLKTDIARSVRAQDGKHLKPESQRVTDVCPTLESRQGWILCPCMRSSPAFGMEPKPGVRLALVPNSLMSNWRKMWEKAVDTTDKRLGMRLFIAHGNFVMDVPTLELAEHPTNVNLLKAATRAGIRIRFPVGKKGDQEGFLVLATAQSYGAWIRKFTILGDRVDNLTGGPHSKLASQKTRRTKSLLGADYNIEFGIACADECHEDNQGVINRPAYLAELPGNPWVWGLSGTPFQSSPRTIGPMLKAIEAQSPFEWSEVPELAQFTQARFEQLCRERLNNPIDPNGMGASEFRAAVEAMDRKFVPFLAQFMIRRTAESRWFGHSLVPLKRRTHTDVLLETNSKYDAWLKPFEKTEAANVDLFLLRVQKGQWDDVPPKRRVLKHRPEVLGFVNEIIARNRSGVVATCPPLMKLGLAPGGEKLFDASFIFSWPGALREMSTDNPFYKYLDDIVYNSPKLCWLWKFLVQLDNRAKVQAGVEQKVVIMSEYPAAIYIVKLMIQRHILHKEKRVAFMTMNTKSLDKTHMLEAFNDETYESDRGHQVRRRKENYQYMLGTFRVLAEGHTLTRASILILMEPHYRFEREMQAYARVHRIGQPNEVQTYRLIDQGSEHENKILTSQALRNEYPGVKVPDRIESPVDPHLTYDSLSPGSILDMVPEEYEEAAKEPLAPPLTPHREEGLSDIERAFEEMRIVSAADEPKGKGRASEALSHYTGRFKYQSEAGPPPKGPLPTPPPSKGRGSMNPRFNPGAELTPSPSDRSPTSTGGLFKQNSHSSTPSRSHRGGEPTPPRSDPRSKDRPPARISFYEKYDQPEEFPKSHPPEPSSPDSPVRSDLSAMNRGIKKRPRAALPEVQAKDVDLKPHPRPLRRKPGMNFSRPSG